MEKLIGKNVKYVVTSLYDNGITQVRQANGWVTDVKIIGTHAIVTFKLDGYDDLCEMYSVFEASELENDYTSHTSSSNYFEFENYSDIVTTIITL